MTRQRPECELISPDSASCAATGGGPRTALAFLCDSPADVDRIYQELTKAGGNSYLAPFDAPWGQRYATVHDHDGNAVDLFAPL